MCCQHRESSGTCNCAVNPTCAIGKRGSRTGSVHCRNARRNQMRTGANKLYWIWWRRPYALPGQ
eukprot:3787315-Rhodomonas_salina.1